MEVSKTFQMTRIEEIKILNDVRLVNNHDLNPRFSQDNMTVQFNLEGDVKGSVNCYLCLDNKELGYTDRNYLFPLFMESMNILIGKQISFDPELKDLHIQLSPPKISLNPTKVDTKGRQATHLYELLLNDDSFDILIQYNLTLMN